ncbi:hypothetical protein SAMN05216367_3443 [Tardiphaga sp. OK245]|nr:hypothetical protein SAMN05216367_3443 [Tardiphaga sp. OK245]
MGSVAVLPNVREAARDSLPL